MPLHVKLKKWFVLIGLCVTGVAPSALTQSEIVVPSPSEIEVMRSSGSYSSSRPIKR